MCIQKGEHKMIHFKAFSIKEFEKHYAVNWGKINDDGFIVCLSFGRMRYTIIGVV